MLRLFIAVTLNEGALARCAAEKARVERALGPFARAVRFPREEGLHFTLKFLGAVPDDQELALRAALELAARETQPFSLELGGLEAFPSAKRPRVIYLQAPKGGPEMVRLAAAIERHVAPLGYPTEARAFTPHVTLARVKDPKLAPRVGERIAALPLVKVAELEVREVSLMRSVLSAGGSHYTALVRAPLGAPSA